MRGYRFGDFELDLDAVQLRRNGQPVRLERRPFDLLVLLVSQPGRLLAREEIIGALWPERVIIDFDAGLNTLVRKVRHALGDDFGEPRFVETVPGRGYRFVAPVTASESAAAPAVPAIKPPATRRWRHPAAALGLLLLATAAVFLWRGAGHEDKATRIAVLPFDNLTGSGDFDYLAQGLAEETSTTFGLINLPGLSVIGGVSARALATAPSGPLATGRQLGIDYLVQSSLRIDGTRIRVTSRLIRVANGEQLWSESFDRELKKVLPMQQELSVAIAEQVRQRLAPEVVTTIDRRQTRNPVAYELYLKGRYEWSRLLPGTIRRAVELYAQAVAEDADYALAWAGIAHALSSSPVTLGANPDAVAARARAALDRALDSGADLAEVQFALCTFEFFVEWHWPLAEDACRRAVSLDPNHARANMLLGLVLVQRHRPVEALEMMQNARELDPLFPLVFANSAYVAATAGDYDAALEFSRQALAINPEFWPSYFQLGQTLLALGDNEAALEAYTEGQKRSGGHPFTVAGRICALARLGREEEARIERAALEASASERDVPGFEVAIVHACLGEDDLAFLWLERALAARDAGMLGLPTEPRLAILRDDPRFESLLERAGLLPALGQPH